MKKLMNLNLKDVKELSRQEMKQIEGGVSAEEYCATIKQDFQNNANNWSAGAFEGFWYGWNNYCN
jgi:hypothetical protein